MCVFPIHTYLLYSLYIRHSKVNKTTIVTIYCNKNIMLYLPFLWWGRMIQWSKVNSVGIVTAFGYYKGCLNTEHVSWPGNQDSYGVAIGQVAYTGWIWWTKGQFTSQAGQSGMAWDVIALLGTGCYLELTNYLWDFSFYIFRLVDRWKLKRQKVKL